MPSPNFMGSVLARATNGLRCAVVQMGSTLPSSQLPIRVAEEYAIHFTAEHDYCYCFLSYFWVLVPFW
jgi:hypothetical protein